MPEFESTSRPLIVIAGSLDATRADYRPPLRDLEHAEQACEDLGRALSLAGCDLVVFSSKPTYVEGQVVRGYADASSPANPGKVIARPPSHGEVEFDLPADTAAQVVVKRDTSGEWELSYYRSLIAADGVILLGGGQSTRIAGIIALLQGVPVLPVATFGGGAGHIRVNLDKVRNDATEEDIALLGQPWAADSGERLVASLLAQRERRRQRREREAHTASRQAWAARVALAVTVLALLVSWLAGAVAGPEGPASPRSLTLLLATPMAAAVAGALLRNYRSQDPRWGWAAARGLAAGLVSVFLYIAGALVSVPDLLTQLDPQRLVFFLVPVALAAGYTFDRVLENVGSGRTKLPSLGQDTPSASP